MANITNMHRQAIIAKYLGPTNHRGARIKATCSVGSATIARDYALNVEEDYKSAVAALLDRLGWGGEWTGAPLDRSGDAYVYVRKD